MFGSIDANTKQQVKHVTDSIFFKNYQSWIRIRAGFGVEISGSGKKIRIRNTGCKWIRTKDGYGSGCGKLL
jgi:hypothetical protein